MKQINQIIDERIAVLKGFKSNHLHWGTKWLTYNARIEELQELKVRIKNG